MVSLTVLYTRRRRKQFYGGKATNRKGVGQAVRAAHGDLGSLGACSPRNILKIRRSESDSEALKAPLRSLLCRNPTVLLGNEFERKFTQRSSLLGRRGLIVTKLN